MFAACARVETRISCSSPCVRSVARRQFRFFFASEFVPLRLSCVFFRRGWYGFLTFSSLVLPFAFFLLVHSALPATRSFLRSIGPVPKAGAWNADCETVRSPGSFSSAPPLLVPPTCTSTSTSSTCVSPARLCGPIRLFFHVATRTAVRGEARLPVRPCRTHRRTSTSAAPRAARTPSTSLLRLPGGAVPPLLRLLSHAHVRESTSCFASCFAFVLPSKHDQAHVPQGVSSPKGSGMAAEGGETDPLEGGARGTGVEMPGRMGGSGWGSVWIQKDQYCVFLSYKERSSWIRMDQGWIWIGAEVGARSMEARRNYFQVQLGPSKISSEKGAWDGWRRQNQTMQVQDPEDLEGGRDGMRTLIPLYYLDGGTCKNRKKLSHARVV